MKKSFFIVILVLLVTSIFCSDLLYVHAYRMNLKKDPNFKSDNVAMLNSGDKVEVLEKKDNWIKVKSENNEGWAKKIFLSSTKVNKILLKLGKTKANKNLKTRVRPKPETNAVAGVRGLKADNTRTRLDRENYQADFDAIEHIENIDIKKDELIDFLNTKE